MMDAVKKQLMTSASHSIPEFWGREAGVESVKLDWTAAVWADRSGESLRFEMMPSKPSLQA